MAGRAAAEVSASSRAHERKVGIPQLLAASPPRLPASRLPASYQEDDPLPAGCGEHSPAAVHGTAGPVTSRPFAS